MKISLSQIKISVVIPTYNEEKVIGNCLASLAKQTVVKDMEIIVVDDGSSDTSVSVISNFEFRISNLVLLKQNHMGPGAARNLGAGKAKGDILVFVDADMEFASDFVEKLVAPITAGKTIGTYSEDEFLLNKSQPLARCWNWNFGRSANKMEPRGYAAKPSGIYKFGKDVLEKIEGVKAREEKNQVFRAILKSSFQEAGGFDSKLGYIDDWSVSQKLGKFPELAKGAIYYHRSPDNLPEIWRQARWFGKNYFLTKNLVRKLYNLFRYCPILAPIKGIYGAVKFKEISFIYFKVVFDSAVFTSVLLSFLSEQKYK